MPLLLWDASALAKRYTVELGQDTVDAIFDQVALYDMAVTPWGYAETYSIILRTYNRGVLNRGAFTDAITLLQTDTLGVSGFNLFSITDQMVFASLSIMLAHNLNATDAAILSAYSVVQATNASRRCLLIASDKRLIRAANLEGLPTLNPETVAVADLPAFLTAS